MESLKYSNDKIMLGVQSVPATDI